MYYTKSDKEEKYCTELAQAYTQNNRDFHLSSFPN